MGKAIPGDDPGKHLDMKGIAIRKSTVAKPLRIEFQNLLVNDILTCEKIDVLKVMKHYNQISDIVANSISEGKTEFLIPKSVKPFASYKNPASVEQVKATIIWNSLEPNQTIVPEDNVKLVKIKAQTPDRKEYEDLKLSNPDKYKALYETIFETRDGEINISKNGFTSLAIPLDNEKIPDYIMPFIDKDLMVNANVKNANILLESLGLKCTADAKSKSNFKSNIVAWL